MNTITHTEAAGRLAELIAAVEDGAEFVRIDAAGVSAVLVPVEAAEYLERLEDAHDIAEANAARGEPTRPWSDVKRDLDRPA